MRRFREQGGRRDFQEEEIRPITPPQGGIFRAGMYNMFPSVYVAYLWSIACPFPDHDNKGVDHGYKKEPSGP